METQANVNVVMEVSTFVGDERIDHSMCSWNTGTEETYDATEFYSTVGTLLDMQARKAGKVNQAHVAIPQQVVWALCAVVGGMLVNIIWTAWLLAMTGNLL